MVYGGALPFGDDGSGPIDEDEIVERLATTAVAVLNLTGTTGNLEGLALATPKYQSEDYHGATIHSGVLPEIELTVYMGVYRPYQDHGNSVVFGLHQDLVKQALDRLMGRAGAEGPSTPKQQAGDAVPGEYFAASVKIDEQTVRQAGIPEQQSAVVKMIQRVSIAAGEDGDSLVVQLAADIVNQQRAEQIQQLLQGLMALLELPIEDLEKDEGFLLLRELVKGIEVTRTGNRVKCQLRKPADAFLKRTAAMLEEAF